MTLHIVKTLINSDPMSEKFQNKYRIPSARWQDWDYGWNGAYFITICTAGREYFFGKIVNGKMVLSDLGILAKYSWHEITNHCNSVELDAFVIMPNHVHGILILTGNEKSGVDELGCHNDDGGAVETRHALSPLNAIADTDVGMGVPGNDQETRHALSLPSYRQNLMKPGQCRFRNQGKKTISSIVGSYKSAISRHAHRLGLNFNWQPRFYDHIIRNDQAYQRISAYISNNPSNWKGDKFFE